MDVVARVSDGDSDSEMDGEMDSEVDSGARGKHHPLNGPPRHPDWGMYTE